MANERFLMLEVDATPEEIERIRVKELNKTLAGKIQLAEEKRDRGNWVPANGGSEVPFYTRSGVRLLYCWQPSSGRHAYLNCDTDLILSDEEAFLYLGK